MSSIINKCKSQLIDNYSIVKNTEILFEQVEELSKSKFEDLLLELRKAYYNDIPEVSDEDYDHLLTVYYNRFGVEYKTVGAPLKNDRKQIVLPRYMQSLDKIKYNEPKKFKLWKSKNKGPYLISDKLDGISGGMWNGYTFTQGEGSVGYDISFLNDILHNNNTIGIVRGEIVMPKSVFQKKYADEYKNTRNMVTGIIGRKTIQNSVYDLKYYVYNWVPDNSTDKPLTPLQQFKFLESNGFVTPFYELVEDIDLDYLAELYQKRKKKADYDIDGLVVYTNKWVDIVKGELVPKNAFAFKMCGDTVETTVKSVEWNISKNGLLKPTIIVKPVDIAGVTIKKTSGFSAKFILENNIGKGTIVKLERSGDVIPYINEVVSSTFAEMPSQKWKWLVRKEFIHEDNINIPPKGAKKVNKHGEKYYVIETVSDVDIVIDNEDNEENEEHNIAKIINFFKTLSAKNLGQESIKKIYNKGFTTLENFFDLTIDDLLEIEGFKKKSAERIYNAIQSSITDVELSSLVAATGILGEGIGKRKFDPVITKFPNILKQAETKTVKELEDMLREVGGFDKKAPETAIKLKDLVKFVKNHPQIKILKPQKVENIETSKLNGKNIVFTGFRDAELEKEIKNRGGLVKTSVSGKTDYLVKEGEETTSKEIAAMNLGVEIFNKTNFIKKFIK
jgi:DNA ligase (NAD+)